MIVRLCTALSLMLLTAACALPPDSGGAFPCPVTSPPAPPFQPPGMTEEYEGLFWYGDEGFWTALPEDGVWRELPTDETGFVQKVVFWRLGYDPLDEPNPALTVSGRRLDAKGPGFVERETTHGWDDSGAFMLVGISIPSPGCWEITAEYEQERLAFTVLVQP